MSPETILEFKKQFPQIIEHELLSKHTNLRIGGPATLFFPTSAPGDLIKAVALARVQGVTWTIFGGGSNILVADDGFDGLVIQPAFREIKLRQQTVTAEAGAITSSVARQTAEAGLAGLEWAVGIPGTIGGAVFGNAGCYDGEIKDNLVSVDCLRLSDVKSVVYPAAECELGYRTSRFKRESHVILRATFKLTPGEPEQLKQRMEEIMRWRKEKQPLDHGSAGCMFKNFIFKDQGELERLKRDVKSIPDEMLKRKSISAGWLVEQAGLLGEKIGDAQVSEKHGNFIVNLGHARAQDVLMLTSKVKMKIRDEYGIMLEDEVQLLGF